MIKFQLSFTILLLCVVAPVAIRANESILPKGKGIAHVRMHETVQDSSVKHRAPERYPLELACEVLEDVDLISLAANKTVSSGIVIHNVSTGNQASYLEELSTVPLFFPLLGNGYYVITVSISDSKSYSGEFEL